MVKFIKSLIGVVLMPVLFPMVWVKTGSLDIAMEAAYNDIMGLVAK